MGAIYSILNKVNGKIYVGLSVNPKRRKKEHLVELRGDKHPNTHLQNAFNKYGEDAFEFNILEYCSDDKLEDNEKWWIKYFDSSNKHKGYNKTTGGEHLSGSANPMYGKSHSEETRRKMSENHGRYYGEDNPFYGKHHTEETRKKLSKSHSKENNWKWGTSAIEEWGGLWFLKEMQSTGISTRKLATYIGVSRGSICSYLRQRGYSWSTLHEVDIDG